MKKCLFLLLLLSVALSSYAQDKRFFVGGGLGVDIGFGNISNDFEDAFEWYYASTLDKSNIPAFALNMFVGSRINDILSVQTGLDFYFNECVRLEFKGYTGSIDTTYSFVNIPILLRLEFNNNWGFIAGPYISLPLGKAEEKITGISGSSKFEQDVVAGLEGSVFKVFKITDEHGIMISAKLYHDLAYRIKVADEDYITHGGLTLKAGYQFSFDN
jgi:hypothetical protein